MGPEFGVQKGRKNGKIRKGVFRNSEGRSEYCSVRNSEVQFGRTLWSTAVQVPGIRRFEFGRTPGNGGVRNSEFEETNSPDSVGLRSSEFGIRLFGIRRTLTRLRGFSSEFEFVEFEGGIPVRMRSGRLWERRSSGIRNSVVQNSPDSVGSAEFGVRWVRIRRDALGTANLRTANGGDHRCPA